jgi:ESS family glutamate:Na+ symporter
VTFFTVHPFHSFNLAVVLLIAGKIGVVAELPLRE